VGRGRTGRNATSQPMQKRLVESIVLLVEQQQSGSHGVIDKVGFSLCYNYDLVDTTMTWEIKNGTMATEIKNVGTISSTH
jgi:hypothetical protein